MSEAFDYIVIGAGSAGCVVANRLSADPGRTVLLLEAGPPDTNMWIHVPAGMPRLFADPAITWSYFTEPEPELGGKRVFWPRGKTLGGCSAINGMAYIRGQPADYDHWAQLGNRGWAWDDVLPHFRRSESHWNGEGELHGAGDGVRVTSTRNRQPPGTSIHRATKAFVDAGVEAGLAFNEDFNGPVQEGVGWIDHTIDDRGRRHTTATAYLKPILGRPNLSVRTDARVASIVIADRRAVGVEYRHLGEVRRADARGEIILSGVPGEHRFPAWSASVAYLRPKSRGSIRLKSADPDDAPAIFANYLTHRDDLAALMSALRLIGKVYATPRIRDIVVRRLAPAEAIDIADDAQLEGFVRSHGGTMYHPVGTCMMGPGEDAVVDDRLRVRGVGGLRVADASIMPAIVSGNTNAPSIMIGEKAAALVLEGDASLAP